MIAAQGFRDKTVAVFGLGGSGLVAARALVAGGANVLAWDDGEKGRQAAAAAGIPVADLSSVDWSDIEALVLAPGVPLTHPEPHWSVAKARAAGVEVIGDIELFERTRARVSPGSPLVAITGTNGKSTTTALISHVLTAAGRDAQMGGNIGVPVLELAQPDEGRIHVLECSSYQIDLTPGLAPSVGVLMNISPDHLDRHGTLENYAAVKERLVSASRTCVVGVDDELSRAAADRAEGRGQEVLRISTRGPVRDGCFSRGSTLVVAAGGVETEFVDLSGIASLRGAHNAQNAAATVCVCRTLGVADEAIREGLRTFPGLAHRMQVVGRKERVLFVNDSKATNADAAERALASYERIYWIAGGKAKAGGIAPLRPWFGRIAKAYLIGEAAREFSDTLGSEVEHVVCGTLEAAVARAARDAAEDSHEEPVVLLSPACASFDQFANFEVRGEAFADEVLKITGHAPGQEVA
jgi:UDP-N-acetylmuramoylalanine--D-glutamate ligase|uniref:UDP-N-acetylmuramoyl-L-alanine--D-glutamate ligase n=1 Tax=Stappia sp. TaxID=1870903 RepID=UPI003BA9302D